MEWLPLTVIGILIIILGVYFIVKWAVKDALKGNPPKKTSEPASITKEQIMKVKDPLERQKLINEHMDLFQK